MVDMERSQENTTTQQNQSDFWNDTDWPHQASDRSFTNISLSLGCCIIIINVITMCLLIRHKKCIEGIGFWQQLAFLCSTDILTGIAMALSPLGYLLIDIHADIYYSFCICGTFLFPLSITLSAGNCCIISIYRYVILRYIDKPNTIWHKNATSFMLIGNGLICISTVSSSLLVVSVLFGFQYKEFCDKMDMAGQNEYKSTYIRGPIVILTVFLIATNFLTILSLVSISRIQSVNSTTTQSLNMMKRNRYATITFVAIVCVLNLATIPTLLFTLVLMLNQRVTVTPETTEVMSRFLCMNSLFNPFIYSLRSTEFRLAVWKDIKAVLLRIRCPHDAP